ncbi:MAG: PfkB family carbohydrate kinase, partial [Bdellovibrionales bacterium]
MSEVLVVGSVGYDSISTPAGHKENILGGSANYFSLAASHYTRVNVVGVVGDDYQEEHKKLLTDRNVNLSGLQQIPGKTFHWEGKYENDMNEAITLDTQLNVFENFDPKIPEEYKSSPYLFLANIDPVLQMQVLDQVKSPKLVGVDTMNYWIGSKLNDLKKVLKRVDVLLINEGEARELTGLWNGVAAAQELAKMGPKGVVIKRGDYGFLMYAENQYFILPAFPVVNVVDPTGAGDTFAGGFFGYLSKVNENWNINHLRQACVHGCLM